MTPDVQGLFLLLDEWVVDDEDHGVAAPHLLDDPQRWATAVVEWGVLLRPVRPTPATAQRDAEAFLRAVTALGFDEQSKAGINAHALLDSAEAVIGWRGGVDLVPFAFATGGRPPEATGEGYVAPHD